MHKHQKRYVLAMSHLICNAHCNADLTGHECGILSVSWCREDADLLLSCGKDNRALCWNPQTSEIIGEVPSFYLKSIDIISNIVIATNNGHLGVPSFSESTNPELLATAYFDGTIGIHTLQSMNNSVESHVPVPAPKPDHSDVFDIPGFPRTTQPTLSLKQLPKWLRRPVSSSFGYGGQLVSVENLPAATGRNHTSVVHLRKVVTETGLVERARKLRSVEDSKS